MKILALETATEACSVALGVGDERLFRHIEMDRGHAEQVLPMVDALLAEGGVRLADLDAIAFGRGPGGFTGVRLAASVAQGLAFGADIGVVPISSLAAVALQAARLSSGKGHVLVVNDARMREVYWSAFRAVASSVEPMTEERVSAAAGVNASVDDSWVAAGRGLKAWPELAARLVAEGAALLPELLPRAHEVLELSRICIGRGQVLRPEAAVPVYVRDKVAEPSV